MDTHPSTSLEGAEPSTPFQQADTGSLNYSPSTPDQESVVTASIPKKTLPWRIIIPVAILFITLIVITGLLIASSNTRRMNSAEVAYATQRINLDTLKTDTPSTENLKGKLVVNGQLEVAGSLQFDPSTKPTSPKSGQIYYDASSRQLGYYNGSGFVYLQGGSLTAGDIINTTNVTNITNGGDTTVNNDNITINYITIDGDDPDPAILLQGDTPGIPQAGNFNISGTGRMGTAEIDVSNINTATIGVGTIATGNLDEGNITTATIGFGTIDTANINLVNTGQIESNGQLLTINKFEEIPGGQAATAGYTSIGSSTTRPVGMFGTKVTTGSSGGPLDSLSVYIGGACQLNTISGCSGPATNASFQVGIYSDDGDLVSNKPLARVAEAGPFYANDGDFTLNSWNTLDMPSLPIQPFTSYWIVFYVPGSWTSYSAIDFRYKTNSSEGNSFTFTDQSWCSWSAWGMPANGPLATCFGGTGPYYSKQDLSTYLNYTTDPSTGGAGAMLSLSPIGAAAFRNTTDSLNAFKVQNAASATTIFNIDTYNMRVAIGKSSADYLLDIGNGDVNMVSGRSLRFGGTKVLTASTTATQLAGGTISLQGATTLTGTATIQGAANFASTISIAGAATLNGATTVGNTLTNRVTSANAFTIQNASSSNLFVANTSTMTISITGTDTTFANLTLNNAHFKSTQTTAPAIATPTNCGITPTAAVTTGSTDNAGSFTITTGTGSTSSTCDTSITFRRAYGTAPKSIIIVGKGNATAAQRQIYVVSSTTTAFTVSFANSTAGTDSTAYAFDYWIIE